jgi:hypothetical protein
MYLPNYGVQKNRRFSRSFISSKKNIIVLPLCIESCHSQIPLLNKYDQE